jgi:hypothetical protein
MSEAKHCPHCGAPVAVDSDAIQIDSPLFDTDADRPKPEEADLFDKVPVTPLLAPGSNDDTFLGTPYGRKVASAEPDPILGQFVATGSSVSSDLSTSSVVSKPVTPRRSSSNIFPTINLNTTTPSSPSSQARASDAKAATEEVEEGDDEEPRRGWSGVLLASYASAVTLGLIWFVMQDRPKEKPESQPPEAEVTKLERGQPPLTSHLSKLVPPIEPILGEHFARMGQPLQIGSLEITPLDVKRQDVKIQRPNVLSVSEVREMGKKALVLRLKVKNTSTDSAFAPLDPAYLRERGDKVVDTFVTTASDERVYPFPLAVASEWSIVGQDLSELRPGEARTIAIATAADAPPDSAGPFTWRVRLRTGVDRTDVIGLVWPASAEAKPKASN